jgi:type IV pilus assembly protein PilB
LASIIELLVKIQLLDDRQHDAVMSRARTSSGGQVVRQIAEMGYATEGTVARAISVELGLPRIDLAMTPPEPAALALLDARVCADRFVLPVALRENGELLWLAMADPTDQEVVAVVKKRTQKRVRPAVAGPSEILRAIRVLYSAPNAGASAPEQVEEQKLSAIEIPVDEDSSPFEVVNVGDDIEGDVSPLSRIARQLGVEVPANIPSKMHAEITREQKGKQAVPPKTDPPAPSIPPPRPFTFEELFAPPQPAAGALRDDLSADDLATLEALRGSLEKGAIVLRALAELCVEKQVISREEIKKRNTGKIRS